MASGHSQISDLGDEIPAEAAPAYNEATRTLDVNQAGLNTQSQVGNDGRIEINIDETNPELARKLEQLQLASQSQSENSPAPPYPALDTNDRQIRPPLPLNIVIHVVGSRGDVQPFVALGRVLKNNYGHRIRLATHGTFKKFVEENGLEFFDIGGDPAELMAFMVKNPGLIPGMKSLRAGDVGKRRKGMVEIINGCWKSCADADEVKEDEGASPGASPGAKPKPFIANAIIANPPSFAHIHCAEKLGIPLHLMFTMPWSPTKEFPHPIANIKSSNTSRNMSNEMSYTLVDMMTWQGLGDLVNEFRSETLELGKLSQAAAISMLHRLKIPYTYCWSPALIPKPKDWGPNVDISGFYFLSLATDYQPEPDLAEFLAAGPPPVYIGFGSIVVDDPNAMTELIFEAVRKTGQRALVSKGWGGFGGDQMNKPDGVFMLGNCPHDWLFKHVSCVVHHGGAGTMAAGITLGRPTVIIPFFGDQPFWGAMVARAGAGPSPIPFKELTAQGLADAISYALKPETLDRAKELGEKIRAENGCEAGAASFHAQLDIDRLRCMLAPNRSAVWLLKTTTGGVCLSAFAATVLGNEDVIDLNQLTLYRPYEYAVDENFAVSNFSSANPILSTVGSYASGLAHVPVNIGKKWAGLVYEPYKGTKAEGWKGLGKGLGKGIGNFFFPKRGLVHFNGHSYGIRPLYDHIKKKLGGGTLSFILAAHFATGFEEVNAANEDEKADVLARWQELGVEILKKKGTGNSSASGGVSKSSTRTSGSTSTTGGEGAGPSGSG